MSEVVLTKQVRVKEIVDGDPLVQIGRQMVDQVLVGIDSRVKDLSEPVKAELAKRYAYDWMRQGGNDQSRALELARESLTPVMVPSGHRTQYNDWRIYADQFVTCLQEFRKRFIPNGEFDREAFSNAVTLNILKLPETGDPNHNQMYEAKNLCDLLVMTERLGWVKDGFTTVNNESYLALSAKKYFYQFYLGGAGLIAIQQIGGTEDDFNTLNAMYQRADNIGVEMFKDRGSRYYPPRIADARQLMDQTYREFNQTIAVNFSNTP